MGRTRRLAALAATAIGAMIIGAPPAGATVFSSEDYAFDYEFSYDDCGFPVDVAGSASGHVRIRQGKGKTDSAFFAHDKFSYTETHTNPATGAYFTVVGRALFNETKAVRVSGSIFEFKAVEAGQPFTIYDADGNLVSRESGSLYHHILFDTEGDAVPGGIEIEDLGTDVHGPHPTFDDDVFCAIEDELIGS